MIETTHTKHLNTLTTLRKEPDSSLTSEQKQALDYAIAKMQKRSLVIVLTNLIGILIKLYLGS